MYYYDTLYITQLRDYSPDRGSTFPVSLATQMQLVAYIEADDKSGIYL